MTYTVSSGTLNTTVPYHTGPQVLAQYWHDSTGPELGAQYQASDHSGQDVGQFCISVWVVHTNTDNTDERRSVEFI